MNSDDIEKKLNKYKLIVKLWEKEFREKNNRIPSKYDIKEARKEIKDAYKMYYKITTSMLSNTLTNALDDEEDSSVSPHPEVLHDNSCSSGSKTADLFDSSNSDIQSPQNPEVFALPDNATNERVWGKHLCRKRKSSTMPTMNSQPSQQRKTSLANKLSVDSMKFTKRNPRKSFTRLNSSLSETGESSKALASSTDFPDFETLLSQKSTKIPEIVPAKEEDKEPELEKTFDSGWIERCTVNNTPGESYEFDSSQFTSKLRINSKENVTFGLSGMQNLPESVNAEVTKVSNEADSDGSVVGDSEDESTILSQHSVRHVLKKRRVFQSILNRQAKKSEDMVKKEIIPNKPQSSPEKAIPKKSGTSMKTRGRKKNSPKSTSQRNIEKISDELYIPPLDTDLTKKPPRIDVEHLKESEKIFTDYLKRKVCPPEQDSSSGDPQIEAKKLSAKEKLIQKVSSGKANENFVRINMKKKMYVRGKKTFNYSRHKKSLWKKKKAAGLHDGPECDGEALKCFECGNPGHFADKCPQRAAFPTVPITDEPEDDQDEEEDIIEESDLITLAEAAQAYKEDQDEEDVEENFMESSLTEEIIKELEKPFVEDDQTSVYSLTPEGGIQETPAEVFEALKLFGHKAFRHGQERAIMRILSGLSTLVTLNTGSGKSLCYQLPALIYSRHNKGITLVISPLVSLMEDQVSGIPRFLNARCLHTNLTDKMRDLVTQELREGKVDLLLVSPEAVAYGDKRSVFGQILHSLPKIAFVCIDEAHCLSQWSHNFRPSYLMLTKILREKLRVSVILGLTATATNLKRDEILNEIGVPDGISGVISDVPLPENLLLTVSADTNRDEAVIKLLESPEFCGKSVIVYCTRRDECERVANFIRMCLGDGQVSTKKRKRSNLLVESYHAGLPASRRRTIQSAFMSGKLKIVVATIAFGMGINKADIRAVIHYNMPKNFESYVQEIGRAGRDGNQARCHLFLDSKKHDKIELQRFIYANSIDRFTLRKLLQKIFVKCACKNHCPGHEIAFSVEETVQTLDLPEENISTLLCYLEQHEKSIHVLSKAYVKCTVYSYGGAEQLKKAAKSCPPLAMAISMKISDGKFSADDRSIEFSTVDVAAALGWDSGVVKYQLKGLEWTRINDRPRKTTISVRFDDLGFRIRARGDFTEEQMDNILEMLQTRVTQQENLEIYQLQSIFTGVSTVASPNVNIILQNDCTESSDRLKAIIRDYFNQTQIKELTEANDEIDETPDDQLERDIRFMVANYPNCSFTGRTLARIFHGISSPNFPAITWGRCKMWRAHSLTNIHRIISLANAIILKMRM